MESRIRIFGLALCLGLLAGKIPAEPLTVAGLDIVAAAKHGDENAVRKILADPRQVDRTDEDGYTALHWAGIRGHWRIFVQLLEAGAPTNVIGADGGTPLHWACHHDRPDMIEKLLVAGADLTIQNRWGRTPLHAAVRRGCRAVAALLVQRGADLGAATHEGWTPLHVAYKSGHPDLVELLLAVGADPACKDTEGRTPAEYVMTRPVPIPLDSSHLDQYCGLYDVGGGFHFKVWQDDGKLRLLDFAPDEIYPIGPDEFYCRREPWRVEFDREEDGAIAAITVHFVRRAVRGTRLDHPLYIGSQACRNCHLGSEHGDQYLAWISSRHALAYWRLASDWAKFLASARPHYRDLESPLDDDRCLWCHTTVAQDPDALPADSYRPQEGIGCEACHGPGSLYAREEIMSDRRLFLAKGGIVPDENACRRCHRDPERFHFAEWWPKIAHPGSAAAAVEE
jgi:hypothetical protein